MVAAASTHVKPVALLIRHACPLQRVTAHYGHGGARGAQEMVEGELNAAGAILATFLVARRCAMPCAFQISVYETPLPDH